MNVVFRVDASRSIGTGHVRRCLALAGELQRGGADVTMVSRKLSGHIIGYVREAGIATMVLPRPLVAPPDGSSDDYSEWLGVSQAQDAGETAASLAGLRPDWLVVDHYSLDAEWEARLAPHVDRLMVVDDLANRPHECDLLLDQNYAPGREDRYDPIVPSHCRLMLGPRFALLRPEYREYRNRAPTTSDHRPHVFVYFGGSDRAGMTLEALRALSHPDFAHLPATVLPGANSPATRAIVEQAEKRGTTTIADTQPHLAQLLSEADIAIGAGGMTTWERMCLGVPSLVVSVAENQTPSCEALARDDLIYYAGQADEVDGTRLGDCLATIMRDLDLPAMTSRKSRMKELVDGMGLIRVAASLELPCRSRALGRETGLNILFLGHETSPLADWLERREARVVRTMSPITAEWVDAEGFDFLVSYRYKHIVSREILDRFPGRAINLHTSYLPWNRGIDPNLWSFIEDTPKGVTIHYMDCGIDTGDIIAQEKVEFDAAEETLATSYEELQSTVQTLFKERWNDIRSGSCPRRPQVGTGTYHTIADRESVEHALVDGWDTPVTRLIDLLSRREN